MPNISAIRRFAVSVLFVVIAASGACFSPLRADSVSTVDLSGIWLSHSGDNKEWQNNETPESTWTSSTLPGSSAESGYTWYRKHFKLPADWGANPDVVKYNRLYLHLGTIHGAATIYINGFQINQLGKSPKADGTGFQAIAPSDDVIIIVPVTAPVQGQGNKTLVNWGADNIISIRLYDTASGPNPTAGPISISLPTLSELYPTSFSTPQADHLFDEQNQVVFSVAFTNSTNAPVPLEWSTDIFDDKGSALPGYQPQVTTGTLDPASKSSYKSSLAFGNFPGFYTFSVNTKIDGNALSPTLFVAGWDASKIRSDQTAPGDFGTFWNQLRADVAVRPLQPAMDKDTEKSVTGISVYRVQYAGLDGAPVYAWVSVPDNLPANPVVIVHIPAYDADPTSPDIDMANRGYVVVNLTVTAKDWTSGNSGDNYMARGIDDPKTYIFRDIEGNVMRAVNLLGSGRIPGVPTQHRLVLWGESQGGGLALITAGLLKQDIAAVVAISPYFSDMPHTLTCVKSEDNPFAAYLADQSSSRQALNITLSYFDTVLFTPKVAAPVFFSVGLMDKIEPPFSEFAAANSITSPHTMDVEADSGHIPPTAASRALKWLADTLK